MSLFLALVLAAAPAPSTCTAGSLIFAPTYHPADIALSPDGSTAVIADRGFLSVNEPATLKVRRYLLPQLNAWSLVKFIDDTRVTAETVDGLRFEIDIRTGDAKRLPHAPKAQDEEEDQAQELLRPSTFSLDRYPDPEKINESLKKRWAEMASALGDKDPLSGARPVSFSYGQEPELGFAVATEEGAVTLLDADNHVLASGKAPGPLKHLEVARDEVLAVTRDGDVLLFDRALKLKTSARVFTSELVGNERPPLSSFAPREPVPQRARRPMILRHVPGKDVLLWLSWDGAVGSFELATKRNTALLEPWGYSGVSGGFLIGANRLVLLAGGVLRVWDTNTGGVVHQQEKVVLAMPSGRTGVLAVLGDGRAGLVDAATGAASPPQCLFPRGCESTRESALRGLTALGAPDGKRFVVVYTLVEMPSGTKWPEEPMYVASFDVPTRRLIAQVRLPEVEQRHFPPPAFLSGEQMLIVGAKYSFPALKFVAKKEEDLEKQLKEHEAREEDRKRRACPPGGRICIKAIEERYQLPGDEVRVLDEKGQTLAVLASLEQPGKPRAQHRRLSFAQVSQDKTRFLLASGEVYGFSPMSGYGPASAAAGAAQVWCMPTAPMPPLPPE